MQPKLDAVDEEILNIEFHECRLIVKALNKYQAMQAASNALGITERSLFMRKAYYAISKDAHGVWISNWTYVKEEKILQRYDRPMISKTIGSRSKTMSNKKVSVKVIMIVPHVKHLRSADTKQKAASLAQAI